MSRIFYAGINALPIIIILIPLFFLYNKFFIHNLKKTVICYIFSCYLIMVWLLVGLPNITYFRLNLSFNYIPFLDMINDIEGTLLNVLLFVPLGFVLPLISDRYINMKNTVLFGLANTLIIEILQIFTYRATDINDIITNLIGTIIGYLLIKILTRNFKKVKIDNTTVKPVIIAYINVFIFMFCVEPFISILIS